MRAGLSALGDWTLKHKLELVFLLVVAVRCAEPVLDGDLFWHMSYAQQMLDHRTLVPDHTIYSWTPADGKMIYCAWLSELTLLGIWNVAGLAGIFALRYAVVLGVAALWHDMARRCGVARGPLFWLVLLVALVASYVGTLPKPELFSLLFFNLLVWILFRAKLAVARGASCKRWLFALPLLFLVWVNTHGAFIIAGPLLVAFVLGEAIHRRRGIGESQDPSPDAPDSEAQPQRGETSQPRATPWERANKPDSPEGAEQSAEDIQSPCPAPSGLKTEYPSPRALPWAGMSQAFGLPTTALPLRPLLISVALCALATVCTPYGFTYPIQLFADNVLQRTPRPDAGWNSAYQSIFSPASWHFGFPVLLLAMLVIFVTALWRRIRLQREPIDWSVLFTFAGYAALFTVYLRTTFYLPPVFVAGTFFLLRDQPAPDEPSSRPFWLRTRFACLIAFFALAASTLFQCVLRPPTASWCGFGIGGTNPVEEAEFLAQRKNSDPRLVNLFNTGGYLLWRLWPQYEVMVDSRSFPYLSWFKDQYNFGIGAEFDTFLKKYPAPLAVIDMTRQEVWEHFLFSKEWEPVFYGRAAIVFQHTSPRGDATLQTPVESSLRAISNGGTALNIFTFARLIGDWRIAWFMQEQLHKPLLRWQLDTASLRSADAYHEAHDALRAARFDQANTLFREALVGHAASETDKVILSLLEAREGAKSQTSSDTERTTIEDGLQVLAAPAQP